MTADLMDEVRQFLPALEATQTELAALYDEKLRSLREADSSKMLSLAEEEAGLVARLRGHLDHRSRILEAAGRAGLPSDSIESLVAASGDAHARALKDALEAARSRSRNLRSAGWIQWVASQRALAHYAELIDLIAHCGERSPVYGPAQHATSGGALLDATA